MTNKSGASIVEYRYVAVTTSEYENWRKFVAAFDAWAASPDGAGGSLFDAMIQAREHIQMSDSTVMQ